MNSVRYKRPASGLLVNYTKSGESFRNHLTLYPLSTDSKITHYVALTTHHGPTDGTEGSNVAPEPTTIPSQDSKAAHVLQGQAQFMQSMMFPGPRPGPALAPLGTAFVPAPSMPHPPLGFFPAPVAVPGALSMAKITSLPDATKSASSPKTTSPTTTAA